MIYSSAAIAYTPGLAKPAKLYPQEYITKPIISLNQSLLVVIDMLEIRISTRSEIDAQYTNKWKCMSCSLQKQF